MSREPTRAIQTGLAALGYATGPADGLFGKNTQAAAEAWLAAGGKAAPAVSEKPTDVPTKAWDARSAASLQGVHKDLVRVMERARDTAPPFLIIEGLRTQARQKQLVASGASQTLNSRHLTGHAVDIVPLDAQGRISWDWPLYHKIAPFVKQAAKDLGVPITWGGDWKSFKDGPHWELPRNSYA